MAKAYFKCHKCGDSVTVVGRNRSDADRLAEYRENQEAVCSECYKIQLSEKRAEKSQQAAEVAAIAGLPVLQGTEKQIYWAEAIRSDCLFNLTKIEDIANLKNGVNDDSFLVLQDVFQELKSQTSSHWWIENRNESFWISSRDFIVWLLGGKEYAANLKTDAELAARARFHFGGLPKAITESAPAEIVADAKSEATVRPESPLTETVAEIKIVGQEVQVIFPERIESFRLLMHKFNFEWKKSYWGRSLNNRNGTPDNRAVEIGNAILNAGFIIRIYDVNLRDRAITADFEPEQIRWVSIISKGEHAGWFAIMWGREDDYYASAKKLPRSKYSKPFVVVPPEVFEEVLDFANLYGFMLTNTAKDAAEQAKTNKEAALIAKATKPKESKPKPAPGKRPEKLKVEESGIDDDLKD